MNWRVQGLRAWLWQRLSAIYLAVFVLVALPVLGIMYPLDFAAWHALFAMPVVSVAVALFFAALLIHTWVGLRNILIDYVHPLALRLILLGLVLLALLAMAVWVLMIVLSVVVL